MDVLDPTIHSHQLSGFSHLAAKYLSPGRFGGACNELEKGDWSSCHRLSDSAYAYEQFVNLGGHITERPRADEERRGSLFPNQKQGCYGGDQPVCCAA